MGTVTRALQGFLRFWWDFIVGDDVTLAVGVVVGLAAVAVLHDARVTAWWILPLVWITALAWSLGRAARRS